ncbi:hypothetical protein BC332_10942 [Capsicum chinense]|nr:hypothetical protein BC332_10942 [Capsicum chinense]
MLQKQHYPSVASDVESVAIDVESVASNLKSVAKDVKFIATDVASVATYMESVRIHVASVATYMESVRIHQTSLANVIVTMVTIGSGGDSDVKLVDVSSWRYRIAMMVVEAVATLMTMVVVVVIEKCVDVDDVLEIVSGDANCDKRVDG